MPSVLVVDNDVDCRDLLQLVFECHGYEVTTAFDGLDALRLCLGEERTFDVICLDIAMPGITGLGVARQLRASAVPTPIVFLSALDRVNEAPLDGGTLFMRKPYQPTKLVERIAKLLEAHATRTGEAWNAGAVLFARN